MKIVGSLARTTFFSGLKAPLEITPPNQLCKALVQFTLFVTDNSQQISKSHLTASRIINEQRTQAKRDNFFSVKTARDVKLKYK